MAIPVSVMESAAYLGLSANARSLLLEVALQFHGDDNGRMLLSRTHLEKRGWRSSDMISKGKAELLAAELIFETVKGQRPSKASWYAVTWQKLDKLEGFDLGTQTAFRRGAYRSVVPPLPGKVGVSRPRQGRDKNAVLSPRHGVDVATTAPPHGTTTLSSVPPGGPVQPVSCVPSEPPYGHPLEKPSDDARILALVLPLAELAKGFSIDRTEVRPLVG